MVSISILCTSPCPLPHTLSLALSFHLLLAGHVVVSSNAVFLQTRILKTLPVLGKQKRPLQPRHSFAVSVGPIKKPTTAATAAAEAATTAATATPTPWQTMTRPTAAVAEAATETATAAETRVRNVKKRRENQKDSINLVVVAVVNKSLVWFRCHLGKAYHIWVCVCALYACRFINHLEHGKLLFLNELFKATSDTGETSSEREWPRLELAFSVQCSSAVCCCYYCYCYCCCLTVFSSILSFMSRSKTPKQLRRCDKINTYSINDQQVSKY